MDDEKVQNVRRERQNTWFHVVGKERSQRQHTGRSDGEHEFQGSVSDRRRADVRIKFITPMRSVAERKSTGNAGKFGRANEEGGN